ncbi:MAG TPA: 16S rRNA (cytidine(1402)-2'-O)-methyltransferase [Candidatus Acidoferrales bacterium]|nr:16S rRNA (cytidine(1402)-2'-O)-methyltransferase [Candidatus Acidoferrales bacterium]
MPKPGDKLSGPGELFVVSTPIGNLEDITVRALRLLKECDVIACEDTRQTRKLLLRYSIDTRTVSYHEHNEKSRAAELLDEMRSGARVALVSDAGTPLVSDPGESLVLACIAAGIRVTPMPGPSATITALAASGLPTERFLFLGFAPAKSSERRREFHDLAAMCWPAVGGPATLIFYEAPHRLKPMLADAAEIFGARRAAIARELTKVHEEFVRGTLPELLTWAEKSEIRGEITLLIEGASPQEKAAQRPASTPRRSLEDRVAELTAGGAMDRKSALKLAARELGIKKRDAYRILLPQADRG